jgi:flagellar motor switch protein FliM
MNQEQTSTEDSRPALDLGRPDTSGPRFRALHAIHETFVRSLENGLSALLQSDIHMDIREITEITAGDYWEGLQSPDCLIALKLRPRTETMILRVDSATAITLLELLLGGKSESMALPRELTEIEWSLLEEVVRVTVRSLGEAWSSFLAVEFEVESLGSDPERITCPSPLQQMVQIKFEIQLYGQNGTFDIAVPQPVFATITPSREAAESVSAPPSQADYERNLTLLQDAMVELEVSLRGPTLEFKELVDLKAGQVLIFDYPLRKPLRASINGAVDLAGHITSAGRRRAFQVEDLP